MIVGDSYVAAANRGRPGYARVASLLLGHRPRFIGYGGSGFVRSDGRPRYEHALPEITATAPRTLVLQVSGNDAVCDLADVEEAMDDFLREVAAACPSTRTVVMGPFWAKDGAEHLPELAERTAKVCAAHGVPYLGGLGWVQPRHIGPDGAHPTWAGHLALGVRVARAVRSQG